MATTIRTVEKRHDNTVARHAYLGRDEEGYNHHLDRSTDRVIRFDDAGDVERVTDLEGRDVNTYRRFVENQIGWETRDTMLAVELADALEGF